MATLQHRRNKRLRYRAIRSQPHEIEKQEREYRIFMNEVFRQVVSQRLSDSELEALNDRLTGTVSRRSHEKQGF